MSVNDQLFYVGQKALINKNGEVLILYDSFIKLYDLPGGKIQEGETDFKKAFLREIDEETKLKVRVEKPFTTTYFEYPKIKHYNAGKKIFSVVYECFYLSGNIKLDKREHDGYEWVDLNSYKKTLKIKTNIYNVLEMYFNSLHG